MVVWAKRRYSYDGHRADLQTFTTMFERRHNAVGMMMIEAAVDHNHYREIFIAVPDRLMLSAFIGYKIIEESELPAAVRPLVANEKEFQARFPNAKVRSMADAVTAG